MISKRSLLKNRLQQISTTTLNHTIVFPPFTRDFVSDCGSEVATGYQANAPKASIAHSLWAPWLAACFLLGAGIPENNLLGCCLPASIIIEEEMPLDFKT